MSMDFSNFFESSDEEHVKREKQKAREMRQSQWWKNLRGQGQCYYCKGKFHPKELTMDHVVPIVRGGRTTKSNIVASCKECNNQKKYMLPIEWDAFVKKIKDQEWRK